MPFPTPLPHSLPTFVNLAQMNMACDQGLQQSMSSIYWPTSFQILEKDHRNGTETIPHFSALLSYLSTLLSVFPGLTLKCFFFPQL